MQKTLLTLALCGLLVVVVGSAETGAQTSGGRLVFSARPNERGAFGWQLFVATPGVAGARRLTRVEGDTSPSWSPDGSALAFEREGFGCGGTACREIWRMNADGTETLLTSPLLRSESPDWAPRGDRIAYVEWRDSTTRIIETDIYTVATDGTDRRQLTSSVGEDRDPAWSPDGRLIAFASDRTGNFELYVMNADGSGQRRLTRTRAIAEYGPAWSPNGRRIAFWQRTLGDAIATMKPNGTDRRRLTGRSADSAFPAWSPEGTRIAYVRGSGPFEAAIWVMSASGRNHRRLVRGPFTEPIDPDWGPAFAG